MAFHVGCMVVGVAAEWNWCASQWRPSDPQRNRGNVVSERSGKGEKRPFLLFFSFSLILYLMG